MMAPRATIVPMECDQWQEAIGAMLDGEDPGMSPELVDAHVNRCPSCRQFREYTHDLRRAHVREATPQPDLAPIVVKTARLFDGTRTWSIARVILVVCAVEVVVLSLSDLLRSGAGHETRHLGAFTIAYAAVMLVVVVRPARARAMLPVALMLGFAILLTALFDLLTGHVPLVDEVLHIPELVSVAMIWWLALPSRLRRDGQGRKMEAPQLRSVDRLEDTA